MLISKEIEVGLGSTNAKYYEGLGYAIPRTYNKRRNEWCIKQGTMMKVKIEDVPKHSGAYVDTVCDYCGKPTTMHYQRYNKQIDKFGTNACRECYSTAREYASKYTFEEVEKMFTERNYILLPNQKVSSKSIVNYICKKHPSNTQDIQIDSFMRGSGCYDCGRETLQLKQRTDFSIVQKLFKERDYTLLTEESDYKNCRTHLTYICKKHPSEKQTITYDNMSIGSGCRFCGREKANDAERHNGEEVLQAFISKNYIPKFEAIDYKNNTQKLPYICKKHELSGIKHITYGKIVQGQSCKECAIEGVTGANSCNWIVDKSEEARIKERSYVEYRHWRSDIFKKDNYICQCCGERGGKLNAHHLYNYARNPELRLNIDNGTTLCSSCHSEFHSEYGKYNNTPEQFEEFKLSQQLNTQQIQEAI
jgi:hypothetical protein